MGTLFEGHFSCLSIWSTAKQHFESLEDWVNGFDSHNFIDFAIIDFTKSFGSVLVIKMLKGKLSKLKGYERMNEWKLWHFQEHTENITKFLKDRTQHVIIDGKLSEEGMWWVVFPKKLL